MEPPSITYSGIQPVNYLGQIHKQNDTNFISSHREVCKQLDIRQAIIREEHKQNGQEKLSKSPSSEQLYREIAQHIHYFRIGNTLFAPPKLSTISVSTLASTLHQALTSHINRQQRNHRLRQIRDFNTHKLVYRIKQFPMQGNRQFFNVSTFVSWNVKETSSFITTLILNHLRGIFFKNETYDMIYFYIRLLI